MRPIDGANRPTHAQRGGPEVRGRARAAEVHALKTAGQSPSRSHWRERAAATPAVEISFSAEAAAVLASSPPVTETPAAEAPVTELSPTETVAAVLSEPTDAVLPSA